MVNMFRSADLLTMNLNCVRFSRTAYILFERYDIGKCIFSTRTTVIKMKWKKSRHREYPSFTQIRRHNRMHLKVV